jgi:hypothetical protein
VPTITVTGTFYKQTGLSAGEPAAGTITFTSPQLRVAADNTILPKQSFTATLDAAGSFSVVLLVTDPAYYTSPSSWAYSVSASLTDATFTSNDYQFPSAYGATVDLADVSPVTDPADCDVTTCVTQGDIAGIQQEIVAIEGDIVDLEAADVVLQGNIDAEELARIAADTALQNEIDAITGAGIVTDITAGDGLTGGGTGSVTIDVDFGTTAGTVAAGDMAQPAIVVEPGGSVQAAIDAANAAGGGTVWLQPGAHTHSGLTMRSFVTIDGGSAEAASLVLAAGANVSCITTAGFASLTGTGANGASNSGPHGWAIRNVEIVGSQSTQVGTSYGIQAYGYDYTIDGVTIRDCLSGGMYTEWGDFGLGGPTETGMESHFTGLKIHHNGGPGWHHRGPHDSHAYDTIIWENIGFGFWAESLDNFYSANGTILTGVHTFGSFQTWGMVWDGQIHAEGCQAEGASVGQVWIRGGDCSWMGGAIYDVATGGGAGLGLRLGDTAGGTLAPGARVDTMLTGWKGTSAATAAIDFQVTAQTEIYARVWMATATGTAIAGTPDITDTMVITVNGAGMSAATAASRSAVVLRGATLHDLPTASLAFRLLLNGGEYVNVNTNAKRFELLQGQQIRMYSDPFYSSPTLILDSAIGHISVPSTTVVTAIPTPGGALGIGAPGIIVDSNGNDMRGLLGFGTGNNAFPGNAITVTFANAFDREPRVVLQAANGATAALAPFPSSLSASGFSIELQFDPADNQAAGTYYVYYMVMG